MPLNRWLLVGVTMLSAALAILALIGALFPGLAFIFKPLTTILIVAYAWPRAGVTAPQRRLVGAGLLLSLLGDIALLWPKEGFLPGLIAFLGAHLAYIAAFCVPVRFAARPLPFVAYALVSGLILAQLWSGVPVALRVPVLVYVVCLATMAAQGAVWWRVAADRPDAALARHAALGGLLFVISDALLATNKFALPVPLLALWVLPPYWLAQWFIAASLRERAATTSP